MRWVLKRIGTSTRLFRENYTQRVWLSNKIEIVWGKDQFTPCYSLAPVSRSVATRAVNPMVVSSNPGSDNILSDVLQKLL